MEIFDSHCHLDDEAFERDLPRVLARMAENEVRGAMIVGIDEARSRRAVDLAERYAQCWASVGVHPHDAAGCSEAVLEQLKALAASPKVRAWGEIGLDFNRMHSPRDDQERWFVRQLAIARELDLPIILHERDSGGRLLELLRAHDWPGRRGVVHCFSGTARELDQCLEMGFYIGVTGIVTLAARGRDLRAMLPRIPAGRLLVETDAPYLTPTPERNRHRRNEPAFVRTVLLKVAEVRGEPPEELAPILWDNTCRLFGIDGRRDAPNLPRNG
ncbi:MAG TPA: TatD family deoxyribonuclease [Desulfobacteraceae bacterium]|nr:TatD family hydrolase [Deltaproteobacteria bacterium]RKZ83810.1 MAG: TatD family deoxyribonuclease [Gammaproteobacteria bacterium]HDI59685.1 TatD family deoxyribonuclease [Desulfobacteraceae bacterium]